MKKFFYFAFAALLCCTMTACGDDDGGVGNPSDIIGEWSIVKEVYVEDGETDIDDEYAYGEYVWGFNEDGTGYIKEDGYVYENFTYRVSGNTLFMSEYGYEGSAVIKQLTASSLVLYEEEYDEEYDCMIQATIYFERYE